MKTPDLTIIILSYNVEKLLLDCLSSVYKTMEKSDQWEVVVIDNASTDSSAASVKKHFPHVKIIQNEKNLGFSAGNNIALKQVKSPYTLLLNPDTIVYPHTIQTVMDYIKSHSDVGAATCRVELTDGSLDYSCHREFPNPLNSFLHIYTGFFRRFSRYSHSPIPYTIHEIDALTGAFALIRTTAGRQISWFDEDYFWNGEDLDFCFRLKQVGWKIFYIPEVKILHYKGASARVTKSGRVKWAKNSTNAMKTFYKKHYSSRYPFFFNWIVYTGIYLLNAARRLKAAI